MSHTLNYSALDEYLFGAWVKNECEPREEARDWRAARRGRGSLMRLYLLFPLNHSWRAKRNEPTKSNKYTLCMGGTECAARLMLSATLIRIHHFVWCYRFIAKWLNYNPFSSQCLFALRHDETNGTQKTHIPFLLVRSQSSHTANATSNGKHGPMSMWKHAIAAVICFTSTHLLDEYFFLVWFAWKCKTTLLTRLQHSAPAITISFHVDQHIHIPNWCIHKIYAIKSTSFCLRIHRIYMALFYLNVTRTHLKLFSF